MLRIPRLTSILLTLAKEIVSPLTCVYISNVNGEVQFNHAIQKQNIEDMKETLSEA